MKNIYIKFTSLLMGIFLFVTSTNIFMVSRAAETLTLYAVESISNISANSIVYLASKDNNIYISAIDASSMSGFEISSYSKNKVVFERKTDNVVTDSYIVDKGIIEIKGMPFLPIEKTMDNLLTKIYVKDARLVFVAKATTPNELNYYVEHQIFDNKNMFDIASSYTLGKKETAKRVGVAIASDVVAHSAFMDPGDAIYTIKGDAETDTYNTIVLETLGLAEENGTSALEYASSAKIVKSVTSKASKIKSASKLMILLENQDKPHFDIWEFDDLLFLSEHKASGVGYEASDLLSKINDIAGAAVKNAFGVDIKGLDIASQFNIIATTEKLILALSYTEDIVLNTYYPSDKRVSSAILPIKGQHYINLLHNRYTSKDKQDAIEMYAIELLTNIFKKTTVKAISDLSVDIFKSIFIKDFVETNTFTISSLEYAIVREAMLAAGNMTLGYENRIEYAKALIPFATLQNGAKESAKLGETNQNSLETKYATIMYLLYRISFSRYLEKAGDGLFSKDIDDSTAVEYCQNEIATLLTVTDKDLSEKVENEKIDLTKATCEIVSEKNIPGYNFDFGSWITPGQHITFGNYEQDQVFDMKKEPLQWKILDVQDGKVLVVSMHGVELEKYNDTWNATWETSEIRKFLNENFYDLAFSNDEKTFIQTTSVQAEENSRWKSDGGNNTNDKLFLLSLSEANKYFKLDCDRLCLITSHAAKGRSLDTTTDSGNEFANWWLRTPGADERYMAYVDKYGTIRENGMFMNSALYAVRPAMWIDIPGDAISESDDETTAEPTATEKPTSNDSYYTRSGDYIYFGSYPQSEVTDESIKSKLSAIAGSTSNWTSYGYYIEGKASDFMKYKDVTYSGTKYRGVYFTQCRPYYVDDSMLTSFSPQDDNGYHTNTIYWFKYEPIKWKILSESNGDAFLVTDMILDSQEYNHTSNNNYANSSIRNWLNSTFYNTAFNSTEQSKIKTTSVDNSVSSTGFSSNPYACSNTNDKIFLLSYKEATNSSYGFSSDSTRVKYSTAYAKAQGAYSSSEGRGWWWLRSPYYSYCEYARVIFGGGSVDRSSVDDTSYGVAAALHLTLDNGSQNQSVKSTAKESTPKATAKITPTAKPTANPTPTPTSSSEKYYTRSDEYIYFGTYPQSEVTDESIKSKLSAIAGSTSHWTSYGYYIDDKVSDFMKYKDVMYNGNKYRGVYFTQYRPQCTYKTSYDNGYQHINGYYTNTIYWFKYEPIKWKILAESNEDAFLVTDMLLDSQHYHTSSNNYANSHIRSWLNSTFYNTAFNSTEQRKIKTTNVDNSVTSTGYSNPYVCSNTNDKIFLLSYKEVTNSSYGFSSDLSRVKNVTAYARVQGAYPSSGSGDWWLRSPGSYYSVYARGVDCTGCAGYDAYDVGFTNYGVAVALHLTLS